MRARRQGHAEQRLGHRVVQLAGQVRALLACREVRGLALQIALQAHLLAKVADAAVRAAELAVDHDGGRAHVGGHGAAVAMRQIELERLCLERRHG